MTKFGYIDLMTEYDQIPMYMYLYTFYHRTVSQTDGTQI